MFTNYVDKFLAFVTSYPPESTFLEYLPTSSCKRSLWMTPNWEIYRTAFPQVVYTYWMVTIYYIIQPPHVRFMAKTSPTSDAERHNRNVIRLVLLQISNFGKLVKKTGTMYCLVYCYVVPILRCAKFNLKSNAKSKLFSNMYLILIVSRWNYCLQEQNNQYIIGFDVWNCSDLPNKRACSLNIFHILEDHFFFFKELFSENSVLMY